MSRGGLAIIAVLLAGAAVAAYKTMQAPAQPEPMIVRDVVVPDLSLTARRGAGLFATTCAQCHGNHAEGSDRGPPLVHPYYRPSHHADGAFHLAVKNGVRQHHWHFGNMPPQPDISPSETDSIIRYVRELQEANGISG